MYLVYDLETETHHKYKRTANPFIPENYVVMRGWKKQGDARNSWVYYRSKEEVRPIQIDDDVTVLVGHNIKFDLLYEMNIPGGYDNIMAFINRGGRIFCTQYGKYLVSGQIEKYHMCSMDDIIEEYGGRKKIDGIKELWNAGVLTSEINPDLLTDYLVGTEDEGRNSGDIGNTELIYNGIMKEIAALDMGEAVKRRMDGLLATTEMEFRGLKVDKARAAADMRARMAELEEVEARLAQHISFIPEEVKFNWGSPVQLSCLLYGGTIRYQKQDVYMDEKTGELARYKKKEPWPIFRGTPVDPAKLIERGFTQHEDGIWRHPKLEQDKYLSGKKKGEGKFKNMDVPGELKVKYQDFFYELPGVTKPQEDWKSSLTDGLGGPTYGAGADIVKVLATRDVPFLKDFTRRAALTKELGTYYARYDKKSKTYVGMLTTVDHNSLVHHSLNHTSTVTSRLSSNNPNMQNIPRGDKSTVKAMFVSRFGDDGTMVEVDYSQLEVVVQGLLSLDPNLVKDLINRVDFHCKRVSAKFGISYEDALVWCKDEDKSPDFPLWKGRRTGVKEFSFQRAYGAGADAISEATGLPLDDVKALIAAESEMYPGVDDFNESVQREVEHSAEPFRDPQRGFRLFRRGFYQAPTGTVYSFRSWDAPEFMRKRGITDTFSPPELKNYPIQGTGGELVQLVLGILVRTFYKRGNFGNLAFLVNTVHDCVWIDCHKSVVDTVVPLVVKIMEGIPGYLKHFYGIDCPVPFPVEAETGPNMLDLKHYHAQA